MSIEAEFRQRAKEVRQRLMYPPNSVPDTGINLKKIGILIPEEEPLQEPRAHVVVVERYVYHKPPVETKEVIEYRVEPKPPLIFNHILKLVSENTDISIKDIKGPIRKYQFVLARWMVAHLAHKLLPQRSLSSIGRELKKDHSSIINGLREFLLALAADESLRLKTNILEEILRAHYHCRPAMAPVSQQNLAQRQQAGLSQPEI